MKNTTQILVAESNLTTIYELEKFVEKSRIEFYFTGSSTEAAEIFVENNFDLVIIGTIGCINEKISTEKLLEKIVNAKIPMLILLENFFHETKKCGFQNCDYLKKPFSKKDFLGKVDGLLEN